MYEYKEGKGGGRPIRLRSGACPSTFAVQGSGNDRGLAAKARAAAKDSIVDQRAQGTGTWGTGDRGGGIEAPAPNLYGFGAGVWPPSPPAFGFRSLGASARPSAREAGQQSDELSSLFTAPTAQFDAEDDQSTLPRAARNVAPLSNSARGVGGTGSATAGRELGLIASARPASALWSACGSGAG